MWRSVADVALQLNSDAVATVRNSKEARKGSEAF